MSHYTSTTTYNAFVSQPRKEIIIKKTAGSTLGSDLVLLYNSKEFIDLQRHGTLDQLRKGRLSALWGLYLVLYVQQYIQTLLKYSQGQMILRSIPGKLFLRFIASHLIEQILGPSILEGHIAVEPSGMHSVNFNVTNETFLLLTIRPCGPRHTAALFTVRRRKKSQRGTFP